MATIVSFHAHPDDEAIATSGTLARAVDGGHRAVLVLATRGELGEPVPGVLAEGEQLGLRRTAEVYEAAAIVGVDRVEFLGWTDSGMMGEPTNEVAGCFWQADVEHAARRLAVILEEEAPEVLTVYDDHGGYGHPDHIQVHRVGVRAAELAGVPVVVQSTMNRDLMVRSFAMAAEFGIDIEGEAADAEAEGRTVPDPSDFDEMGTAEADLTHVVDVSAVLDRKRAAMLAHRSQIGPDHFMARMPPEAFAYVFGQEWYRAWGTPQVTPGGLFEQVFRRLGDHAGDKGTR